MLKLHSFKMSEESKMNELLDKNRIAQGAAVMVSNGEIIIPIEDGEPLNTAQLIIKAKEERNTILLQLLPIYHSQKVLDKEINFLKSEVTRLDGELENTKGSSKDDLKLSTQIRKNIDSFKNMIAQKENMVLMNDAEIKRFEINVDTYNEYIDSLSN